MTGLHYRLQVGVIPASASSQAGATAAGDPAFAEDIVKRALAVRPSVCVRAHNVCACAPVRVLWCVDSCVLPCELWEDRETGRVAQPRI